MKKNLVLLTGIVLVFAILLTCGCNQDSKSKKATPPGSPAGIEKEDSTKVDIFLKAVSIDGSMHLEMYDSKKDSCPVIDGLITVVYGGYTVAWKKAQHSDIHQIVGISAVNDSRGIFGFLDNDTIIDGERAWKLEIPIDPDPDTIKYKIDFTHVDDHKDTTYTIDPYLRIPKQQ